MPALPLGRATSAADFPTTARGATRRAARWAAALYAGALLLLPAAPAVSAPESPPPILINELLYAPAVATDKSEFVELYNAGSVDLSLRRWTLRGAVDYTFPATAVIPAGAFVVIAEEPAALQALFGAAALGPFSGRLAADGERLRLRDPSGDVVDEVEYSRGFPWPTAGLLPGASIQLIHSRAPNDQPGAWRSAAPTPGAPNSVAVARIPPLISAVRHEPQAPRPGDAVLITVELSRPAPISAARVGYQVVLPGAYISQADQVFEENWQWLPLTWADATTLRVQLPAALQKHRSLIRYRVEITHSGGTLQLPYADDPQPNFAYFVYGDLPAWQGAIDGAAEGWLGEVQKYDFAAMGATPVYHFIAKESDVADALFMPPSTLESGYEGSDYLWQGTLVYNGVVYDHVGFRARGGELRYTTGKNSWQINFLAGHSFRPLDDRGRPFEVPRDKLVLNAAMQHAWTGFRGEAGIFEAAGFRLFALAGVAAPQTNFVHWRVIDAAAEQSASQYSGDFWGLYLAVERMDGSFLDQQGLPDGNLYQIDVAGVDRHNLGRDGPDDLSDLARLQAALQNPALSDAWWRAHFDLDGYYSYRAVVEFLHHYDIAGGHNSFYYHNALSGKWSVLPWDLDKSWHEKMGGSGEEPFKSALLARPAFALEYQNRLRELRDLLLTPEAIQTLLDEYAALIDTPADANSLVDADRALWDYNPIFETRYVDEERTWPGAFYGAAPDGTFRSLLAEMNAYARRRFAYIDANLLTDGDYPQTPALRYTGDAAFAADSLRFEAGPFADPQGDDTFAAMQWRFAEVNDPAAPARGPDAPPLYEVNTAWQSAPLGRFAAAFKPPAGVVQPGHAYRVRVRFQDNSGRWSHWSESVAFVATPPAAPAVAGLRFSEVLYHPAAWGDIPGADLEFVELWNSGNVPLDLGGMRLSGGADFRFPVGTLLAPNTRLVIAGDAQAFRRRYGFAPRGEFARSLSDSGDLLLLADSWERSVARLAYGDAPPWPPEADGPGYSLVLDPAAPNPEAPSAWRRSLLVGGSPGSAEDLHTLFLPVLAR